jgi:sensor histidine kinase YesM
MENRIKISTWLRWTYAIFFGVLFKFVLDVIFSLVYAKYSLFQPYQHYLISIFSTYLSFELIFLANGRLNKRLSWEHGLIKRFLAQYFINSLIAILIVTGLRWAINLSLNPSYYISFYDELIIVTYILILILIYVTADLSIFLLNKWRFSLAELERFKKENAEIRFESLRSQLNPHFLFNSLNTLSSLVYENQEKAGLFIRELSDVYRYILESREKDLVNLDVEMKFAESYINLLQLRFGENLQILMEVETSKKEYMIAPLSLQLLIENAVKHNVISKKHPLKIDIITNEDFLIVTNNLQPKNTKEYSSELGLKNIQSRYGFLTNTKVEVLNNMNEFIVKIPLIK